MRSMKMLVLVPVAVLVAACGRGNASAADDGLKNDLALASQAQGYMPQQFVSPAEAGYGAQPYNPYAPQQVAARQPVARRTTATRPAATRRASTGTIYRAPAEEPPMQVIKHTHRDAAIGAAAGAIIGATTSRDRVKGAVIGAVAGGILGGVIGNNVDVQRKPQW
jgi:hypothetical protein